VECRQIGGSCEEYYYCYGECQDFFGFFLVVVVVVVVSQCLVWTWVGCREIELGMGL
jgi:hypothetical protein